MAQRQRSADTDGVGQIITIPTGCTTTLTYWVHIDTTESTTAAADDTLKVQMLTTTARSSARWPASAT